MENNKNTLEELQKEIDAKKKEEKLELQRQEDNKLVTALMNNDTAIDMARKQYEDLKNQKNIANKMNKVVNRKTNADIDAANIKVEEQEKDNRVKKQQIKNELLKLHNDKVYMQREQKHRLKMQKFAQRKEKYGELLTRHCQKRQKNKDGKWEYLTDENGKPIINMPNGFVLFWLIVLDSIVQFLNLGAEIIGKTNKVVFKSLFIIFIILLLFVAQFRTWLLGLIGIG